MSRRRRKRATANDYASCFGCLLTTVAITAVFAFFQYIWNSLSSDPYVSEHGLTVVVVVVVIFVVLVISVGILGTFVESSNRKRLCGKSIGELDVMSGKEFELWIVAILKSNEFNAHIPTRSADYGVDVIAKLQGNSFAIQAKRYKKNVGIKAVQEISLGAQYWKCDFAAVITQSHFTKPATRISQSSKPPVILIDRDLIYKIPKTLKKHIK